MMNSTKTILFSPVLSIKAFPDDDVAGGFYALPLQPRIKTADNLLMLTLLVHGQQAQSAFETTGGLLNCTTSLELTEAEQLATIDALRATLPPSQVSSVQLLPISWTYGKVALNVDSILALEGSPSLIGGNDCVFQAQLSGPATEELETQWRSEGYRLHVSYQTRVLARGPTDFAMEATLQGSPSDAEHIIRRLSP